MSFFTSSRAVVAGAAAGLLLWSTAPTRAASPLTMTFTTHAAFFSSETKQAKALDPQVFVQDAAAKAATGPQGIKHVAGVRPPLITQDAGSSAVFTADGRPLGFDLKTWLGAKGTVTIAEQGGKVTLQAVFTGLKPNGKYSLFENHFDLKPVGFTPMDGTGQTNSFVAQLDGSATISMVLTHYPTHDNAVLLVYHSDGQAHARERGHVGIDVHHQLIARPQ